jgi:hypothetical protein
MATTRETYLLLPADRQVTSRFPHRAACPRAHNQLHVHALKQRTRFPTRTSLEDQLRKSAVLRKPQTTGFSRNENGPSSSSQLHQSRRPPLSRLFQEPFKSRESICNKKPNNSTANCVKPGRFELFGSSNQLGAGAKHSAHLVRASR